MHRDGGRFRCGGQPSCRAWAGSLPGSIAQNAVLSGSFVRGQLPAGALSVSIKEGDWRDLPEGSSFELYPVPAEDIHVADGTWAVSLDPASIPSKFVARDGQVDFLIEGHDPASGMATFHTVSAMRVKSLIDATTALLRADDPVPTGWVALPGLPSADPSVPAVATEPTLGTDPGTDELEADELDIDMNTSTVIPDPGELTGIPLELIKDPAGSAVDDDGAADTSFLLARPDAVDAAMTSTTAPNNCREISGYRYGAQTTVATGYPVGGDESSLTYTSTLKTTSGTAISTSNGWSESGSESTTDGWGADFYKDPKRRSYRTVVTYGWYSCCV